MCLIVVVNGSPRTGSRTGVLLNKIAEDVCERVGGVCEFVDLGAEGKEVLAGAMRDQITKRGEELVALAERADLLIVGSPIYRASYTGLLKHYFDMVDRDTMVGRTAILAASGGSYLHGLVIEHQLRPLMGFFGIQTTPTAPYAITTDFASGRIVSDELQRTIDRCSREAAALLAASTRAELAGAA